jgi:patatin-like phospholipase/acyl hydrolase
LFSTPNNFTEDNGKRYVDVALATSAAPTYLPIHNIDSSQFVDGGVWANNPSLVGLMEYLYQFADDERFNGVDILSISSLELPQGGTFRKTSNSFADWGAGLIDLFSIGQAKNMEKLFQFLDGKFKFPMRYVRIANSSLSPQQIQLIDMDNASKASLDLLQSIGIQTAVNAKMNQEVINFFVTKKTI